MGLCKVARLSLTVYTAHPKTNMGKRKHWYAVSTIAICKLTDRPGIFKLYKT